MRLKTIVDEDFTNYKKPAMFIGTISCNGKCCIEAGIPLSVCHNDGWRACAPVHFEDKQICERYLANPITQAIVFGGLEPFEQFDELLIFIDILRCSYDCHDDIVVYTGYNEDEVADKITKLKVYDNIIVKFGRYIPNSQSIYDDVLGVTLASINQKGVKIS